MNSHWKDIVEKLKSDRIWALVGFVALVLVNAYTHLLDAEQMKAIMWATLTFIVGKSIRGTPLGGVVEDLAGGLLQSTTKVETQVSSTPAVRRPEDVP